ncbi:MAG: hypothetical protein AB7S93_07925 [Xanthobacteraceae bacterium]
MATQTDTTAAATTEALAILRALAKLAQTTADLGGELQRIAASVEHTLDTLAPRVGCTVEDVYFGGAEG